MSPPVDSWIWWNIPHSSGLNGVPIDPRSNPWKRWILPYMIKSLQKWLRILRWTLFWVIQVGPNAIPCVFKRKIIHAWRRRQWEDRAERNLKILALKIGVKQPQAKECWQPPELEETRNRSFPRAPGGQTCQHLDFTHLTSGTLGE